MEDRTSECMSKTRTSFKKGHTGYWLGKHLSKEHKEKLSEASIGHISWYKGKTREKSSSWKGGFVTNLGYLLFRVPEGCRFACMKKKDGYVLVHRLMMAEYLNRPLTEKEIVHHINGDISDNRIENLELMTLNEHAKLHNNLGEGVI